MQAVCLQIGRRRPPPALFQAVQGHVKHHPASKTEPIWPLSEPVIKASRVQMGGGGLCPPQPPRFCLHRQDLLRAHNCYRPVQTPSCRQSICKRGGCLPPNPGASTNRSHIDFLHPACRQSICKWGGYVSPNPRAFLNCARRLQVSSCQQKQNPYGPAQNP